MTDKELLEMAAKAAEIEGEYQSWSYNGFREGIRKPKDNHRRPWNPLTEDDDALRLAVKLNLAIYPQEQTTTGTWSTAAHWGKVLGDEFSEKVKDKDPYAATRRAVVRAAAEIGKTI